MDRTHEHWPYAFEPRTRTDKMRAESMKKLFEHIDTGCTLCVDGERFHGSARCPVAKAIHQEYKLR